MKANKAQARLERASLAVGCSKEAIAWMESALDPFPDEERLIAGYPDMISSKSVVQAFREKVTVSTPAGLAGANWDVNIFMDGFFKSVPVVSTSQSASIAAQAGQGATPYNLGGVTVRSAAAGTPLYLTTSQNAQQLVPSVSSTIPYRVIACGLEIWNTTAPLYRQGNVIVWRQPRNVGESGIIAPYSAVPVFGSTKTFFLTNPPETASQALLLGGSKTWAAEKGAYCVGTLAQQEIDVYANDFINLYTGVTGLSNGVTYFPAIALNGTYPYVSGAVQETAFNQFGAYFTGLSAQTTLDVTLHYIVERFPPATSTDLVTMASNSCPYDPKALELYSKTVWHLPAGTWVEENGLGDWLSEVADVLGNFGVPGMGIAKSVIKGVQGISNSFDNAQRQQVESSYVRPPQPEVVPVATPKKKKKKKNQQQQKLILPPPQPKKPAMKKV
jgi:hypothetical protein